MKISLACSYLLMIFLLQLKPLSRVVVFFFFHFLSKPSVQCGRIGFATVDSSNISVTKANNNKFPLIEHFLAFFTLLHLILNCHTIHHQQKLKQAVCSFSTCMQCQSYSRKPSGQQQFNLETFTFSDTAGNFKFMLFNTFK